MNHFVEWWFGSLLIAMLGFGAWLRWRPAISALRMLLFLFAPLWTPIAALWLYTLSEGESHSREYPHSPESLCALFGGYTLSLRDQSDYGTIWELERPVRKDVVEVHAEGAFLFGTVVFDLDVLRTAEERQTLLQRGQRKYFLIDTRSGRDQLFLDRPAFERATAALGISGGVADFRRVGEVCPKVWYTRPLPPSRQPLLVLGTAVFLAFTIVRARASSGG